MSKPLKYRKKPVVIEAILFDGSIGATSDITEWTGGKATITADHKELDIKTLEGVMHVSIGDYVIKGVKGEFYPCKPDIFKATYEKAD